MLDRPAVQLSELDYDLPEALIAQRPSEERDAARLLVLHRDTGELRHEAVRSLPRLLPPRSLLVVNDTRVIPARLHGRKPTGGRVELLLVERLSEPGPEERWAAMGRASKGLRQGMEITLGSGALRATVERSEGRDLVVRLAVTETAADGTIEQALAREGEVPLPPYIRRSPEDSDRERYQTVFAERPGAVAAPTAGLHLSHRLLDALSEAGHGMARVTLHVGPGTFAPLETETLEDHRMHTERFEVPEQTADAIAAAREEGRPVVAVGTTVVRTLESVAMEGGRVRAGAGQTDIFIHPPRKLRVVDGLLTNFHLPRSTLLALVMAFAGVEPVRRAYAEAVRERYRFFSYGDAMLIAGDGGR